MLERCLTLATAIGASAITYLLAVTYGAISAADAERLVLTLGAIAAALVAIAAGVKVLSTLPPVRWVWRVFVVRGWRSLVAEPMAAWIARVLDGWASHEDGPVQAITRRLDALEAQNIQNDGSTNRDRLNAIAGAVGAPPDPVDHP